MMRKSLRHIVFALLFWAPAALLRQPAAFPTITVGQWYDCAESLSSVYYTPTPPGVTGPTAIMSAWGSAAYDTRGNRLLVAGGGHTDYGGNELYAFKIDSGTCGKWVLLTNSAIADSSDVTNAFYTNGHSPADSNQPRASHKYDGLEYDSTTNRLYDFGATFTFFNATTYRNIYAIHLDTLVWHRVAAESSSLGGGNFAARDPANGKMWFFANGGGAYIGSLNTTTNAWTNAGNFFQGNAVATYVTGETFPPVNRTIAVGGGVHRYWLTGNSGSFDTLVNTLSTTGCTTLQNGTAPGFAYSSASRKMVGWVSGTHVWTMDSTYTCTDVSPDAGNSVTPSSPQTNGTFGRFRYVPEHNVFILVNSTTGHVYYYKQSADPAGAGASFRKQLLGVGQ